MRAIRQWRMGPRWYVRRTVWRVTGACAFVSVDGRTAFYVTRNGDGRADAGASRCSRFDAVTGEAIGHTYGSGADDALQNGIAGWGAVRPMERT